MRTHLVAFALTAAAVVTGHAQGVQLDATSLSARHELLGNPLYGVSLSKRVSGGVLATVRVALDLARGRAERIGTTCTGLIPPTGCPPERMRDKSGLAAAGVGVDMPAIGAGAWAIVPTLDARLAWISVVSRGETSGQQLDASKRFLSLMAGLKAQKWVSGRWAVRGGIDVGLMNALTAVYVADGYTPFENGFGFHRITIGAIWTPRR